MVHRSEGAAIAHHTVKQGYLNLVDRLNLFPQGAPPSDLLYRILKMLFSEREAQLVAQLPIRPFTAERAATTWKMPVALAKAALDELAGRAILVDIVNDDETTYTLPPPMAGFFEFSMMRVRGDLDQKVLAELFFEYLNVEEDFIKDLFTTGETQLGRTFVCEESLPPDPALDVLDYERATQVAETASHIGVDVPDGTKILLCEVDRDHPLLWTEQLMPVIPLVRVKDAQTAIRLGFDLEHGYRHTAMMHSRNIDNLSEMARLMNCSLFVKNGPSYAGLGKGGAGFTSFTIASPTGEGLTRARTFTRERRCTLVDRFRIV